jgi:hypothetical protein
VMSALTARMSVAINQPSRPDVACIRIPPPRFAVIPRSSIRRRKFQRAAVDAGLTA